MYLTLTTSDGFFFYLYCLEAVRRQDLTLYRHISLDDALRNYLIIDGKQYCWYADTYFALKAWLVLGYDIHLATPSKQAFNTAITNMKTSLERTYKDIKHQFTMNNFSILVRIMKIPITLIYKALAAF